MLPGHQPRLTVFVVEDEDAIRRMLDVAFRRHGLDVLLASTGDDAVAIYREHRHAIAVVLLDVRMPDLDGPATLAALRVIDPEVRAGFVSGDTGTYTTDDLIRAGASFVIAKPFDVAGVVDALRRLVGSTESLKQNYGETTQLHFFPWPTSAARPVAAQGGFHLCACRRNDCPRTLCPSGKGGTPNRQTKLIIILKRTLHT